MNPVEQIKNSRTEARKLRDPNADICFLALADNDGRASIRTLVLRDIGEIDFTIFINQTSPKWKLFSAGADYELLIWYPSQQHQFRIKGTAAPLDANTVGQNWLRRPQGSKYLDYIYEGFQPQSSELASREQLTTEVQRLKEVHKGQDMQAPSKVAGMKLIAGQIELLDLNHEDRIHSRRRFNFVNNDWQMTELVP